MNSQSKPVSKRLHSLDALRGFDMFWIMGGESIFTGLATLTGWPVFQWWASQLEHVEWHGFRFYDMIFPLFLFIAGISFPYSLAKRKENGEPENEIEYHLGEVVKETYFDKARENELRNEVKEIHE